VQGGRGVEVRGEDHVEPPVPFDLRSCLVSMNYVRRVRSPECSDSRACPAC